MLHHSTLVVQRGATIRDDPVLQRNKTRKLLHNAYILSSFSLLMHNFGTTLSHFSPFPVTSPSCSSLMIAATDTFRGSLSPCRARCNRSIMRCDWSLTKPSLASLLSSTAFFFFFFCCCLISTDTGSHTKQVVLLASGQKVPPIAFLVGQSARLAVSCDRMTHDRGQPYFCVPASAPRSACTCRGDKTHIIYFCFWGGYDCVSHHASLCTQLLIHWKLDA